MRTIRASGAVLLAALCLLLAATRPPAAHAAPPLPSCLGETRSLIVSSGMPYTPIRMQGRTGFFVVDLGADGSAISPSTFLGGQGPLPLAGSASGGSQLFEGLEFFGPWAPVRLSVQDHSGIRGPLPQAGLIGTDLLRDHVLTLDYANGLLHRTSRDSFCSDATLRQAGFLPLSTRSYYGQSVEALRCPAAPRGGPCPNIPTIPLRIGGADGVAQVDTGYDDSLRAPSLNINPAMLARIAASGVKLQRVPAADLSLSSCVPGEREAVLAHQLPTGVSVDLIGTDGRAVRRLSGVTLYLKSSPPAIRRCGGIGTWSHPAAQLGASVVNDGTLVVDPFSQRLWFRAGGGGVAPSKAGQP